jgi:hypothetical protein
VRAPQANAIAERFVRTIRSECLDWLLILNRRHLEQVLRVFVDHYNRERPHRALDLLPPRSDSEQNPSCSGAIHRRDRIGASWPLRCSSAPWRARSETPPALCRPVTRPEPLGRRAHLRLAAPLQATARPVRPPT